MLLLSFTGYFFSGQIQLCKCLMNFDTIPQIHLDTERIKCISFNPLSMLMIQFDPTTWYHEVIMSDMSSTGCSLKSPEEALEGPCGGP